MVDSIAEQLSFEKMESRLKELQGECLVTLIGVESFSEDLSILKKIKQKNPRLVIVCFGYYATQFSEEILAKAPFIDFIVKGEPEQGVSELYRYLERKNKKKEGSDCNTRIFFSQKGRIDSLDELPFPDRDQLPARLYSEFLCPQPFTSMLTARGCPQGCSYCIPTYGKQYIVRSVSSVIEEIQSVIKHYRIKMIRFMDDDFCLDRDRVVELCQSILHEGIKVQWSCLSRPKNLDKDLLKLMSQSGCRRVYMGVESFSLRLGAEYGKRDSEKHINEIISRMHSLKMECIGFFLVGGEQNIDELMLDIHKSIKYRFDHVIVSRIIPYPGTKYYDQVKEQWEFSLFPYKLKLKNVEEEKKLIFWEKQFYRSFYLRGLYFLKACVRLFLFPKDLIRGAVSLVRYLRNRRIFKQKRQDLL